jgi:hypothetical protein
MAPCHSANLQGRGVPDYTLCKCPDAVRDTWRWNFVMQTHRSCICAQLFESQEGGPFDCLQHKVPRERDRCATAEPIAKAFVAGQSDTHRYLQENRNLKGWQGPWRSHLQQHSCKGLLLNLKETKKQTSHAEKNDSSYQTKYEELERGVPKYMVKCILL